MPSLTGLRLAAVLAGGVALATPFAALGQTPKPADGVEAVAVDPIDRPFLTRSAANVRALPAPGAARVGGLDAGQRVRVVGRPPGTAWYAVAENDRLIGYVYEPLLIPLLDGRLKEELRGTASGPGGMRCSYTVRFDGRTEVEGDVVPTADYWVRLRCPWHGRTLAFAAFMFMTETPYRTNTDDGFQINVDLAQVGAEEYDEPLSASMTYHREKATVRLDSLTPKAFAAKIDARERPAADIAQALGAAVELAIGAWNEKVFEILARQ